MPENNDFLLGSQFWVAGELYLKRPDLVGFVNGLPLVLVELKKPGVNVRDGFDKNLRDYKQTIPQLFHYNALLLVSNGVQSKIGSLTAKWEHFGDWKRAAREEILNSGLPEKYTTELFEQKCGVLFQHVLEKYPDQGTSVYSEAG